MLGFKRPLELDPDSDMLHESKLPKICLPHSDPLHDTLTDRETLHFRASALAAVDSSDDENDPPTSSTRDMTTATPAPVALGHRPAALDLSSITKMENPLSLLANGDHLSPWLTGSHGYNNPQPSPIPHTLVAQSLNISTPTISAGFEHAPFFIPENQCASVNCTEATAPQPEDAARAAKVRLPSPMSDEDMEMSSGHKTPSDVDMAFHSPNSSMGGGITSSAEPIHSSPPPPKVFDAPAPKRRIVMGFRKDCEKCQRRVPGHYIHIRAY